MQRRTCKAMNRRDLPDNSNTLSGRLLLADKSFTAGKGFLKARYVIGGHQDQMKGVMVHTTAVLGKTGSRLPGDFAIPNMDE